MSVRVFHIVRSSSFNNCSYCSEHEAKEIVLTTSGSEERAESKTTGNNSSTGSKYVREEEYRAEVYPEYTGGGGYLGTEPTYQELVGGSLYDEYAYQEVLYGAYGGETRPFSASSSSCSSSESEPPPPCPFQPPPIQPPPSYTSVIVDTQHYVNEFVH